MPAVYTYSNVKTDVNSGLSGKFDNLKDGRAVVNRAVRHVLGEMDMRSMKRKSQLSPGLFTKVYDYPAPSTLKGNKIVDIKRQVNRTFREEWELVDEEEFDRRKAVNNFLMALADADFIRILKLSGLTGQSDLILHGMESLTSNGTWGLVAGTDATNLRVDSVQFINGAASIEFDTNTGLTSAAIENSTIAAVDLTKSLNQSSIFVWVYIPLISGLQSFNLRWGQDSSNYWNKTVTVNNENNAFYLGWNLLRFDWSTATKVGSPSVSSTTYLRFTINKTGGMAAASNWRVDYIVNQIGTIYDVIYYTKYGWQTSAGVYIENSTADTDFINLDTDELELIVLKAIELGSFELKDKEEVKQAQVDYIAKRKEYNINSPSEAKLMTSTYHDFSSITGNDTRNFNDLNNPFSTSA